MISGARSTPPQGNHARNSPVVYVVDDDESMRVALGGLLRSMGLRVEEFESSADFLAFPKHGGPSCLILDVRLRGESGLTLQQEIAKMGIQIPILFITGYGDIEMCVRAMKAGALDFIRKPFRDQDMLDAVAQALKYDTERVAMEQSLTHARASYDSLTPREKDVLGYVLAGLMNKHIASEMDLSENTIKIHRGQVMKKMGVRSVADLVRKAEAINVVPTHPKSR